MQTRRADIAIIGAGSVGIAIGYYLTQLKPALSIALIDEAAPMSLTSAASGENYRNWWPHPVMKQFMDRSIELFSGLNERAEQSIVSSRAGYLLATRDANPADLLDNLRQTFTAAGELRHHDGAASYRRARDSQVDGVDILQSTSDIQRCYNGFDEALQTIVHIRRGGSISTHHLGSYMLAAIKSAGGTLERGTVFNIERDRHYSIDLRRQRETVQLQADVLVNAAGPFSQGISDMLGISLPIENTLQQKIAFADRAAAIDRRLPFTIDLDAQQIDWSDDEREAIAQDPALARFAETMPGSIHCRPDGAVDGKRIKIGWAYNAEPAQPHREPALDAHFPEIALRGASRLQPALKVYLNGFPRDFSHYGGYYTLTPENWPLIGATDLPGYFIATAMSGFGSMAACAAGELTAQTIIGTALPNYARALSLQRYRDTALMQQIHSLQSKGIL